MKKTKLSKLMAAALGVIMSFSVVACGGNNGDGSGTSGGGNNGDKVQLDVTYFGRGFGGEYVAELAKKFEEKYEDVQFGDKKGVYVEIKATTNNNLFRVDSVFKADDSFDVALTENTYLDVLIEGDALMDISDVVNTASKYDNKTIASKMTAQQIDYLTRDNGAIYAVPHYASSYGIVYNTALFEENNWYFKDGHALPAGYNENDAICDYGTYIATDVSGMFVSSPVDRKTAGPDGVYDTDDDGLPTTYDEFFWLCKKIQQSNAIPVSWAGKYYMDYLFKFMKTLLADAEGCENYLANFDPVGKEVTDLVEVDNNGNVTKLAGKTLTSEDAADIRKQKGLYDALRFMNVLVNGELFHADSAFKTNHEHTDNQNDFVESYADEDSKSIAMIIDGAWWEREATDNNTFIDVEDEYGAEYSKENLKFGWMTLPKVSKAAYDKSKQSYVADSLNAFVVVKKNVASEKVDLAKDFVRYACSDEALQAFTVTTGAMKALKYTIDDKSYKELSNFGKAYYDAMTNETTVPTFVYTYSKSALYARNSDYFVEKFFNVNATGSAILKLHELGASKFNYSDAKNVFDMIYAYSQNQMNNK